MFIDTPGNETEFDILNQDEWDTQFNASPDEALSNVRKMDVPPSPEMVYRHKNVINLETEKDDPFQKNEIINEEKKFSLAIPIISLPTNLNAKETVKFIEYLIQENQNTEFHYIDSILKLREEKFQLQTEISNLQKQFKLQKQYLYMAININSERKIIKQNVVLLRLEANFIKFLEKGIRIFLDSFKEKTQKNEVLDKNNVRELYNYLYTIYQYRIYLLAIKAINALDDDLFYNYINDPNFPIQIEESEIQPLLIYIIRLYFVDFENKKQNSEILGKILIFIKIYFNKFNFLENQTKNRLKDFIKTRIRINKRDLLNILDSIFLNVIEQNYTETENYSFIENDAAVQRVILLKIKIQINELQKKIEILKNAMVLNNIIDSSISVYSCDVTSIEEILKNFFSSHPIFQEDEQSINSLIGPFYSLNNQLLKAYKDNYIKKIIYYVEKNQFDEYERCINDSYFPDDIPTLKKIFINVFSQFCQGDYTQPFVLKCLNLIVQKKNTLLSSMVSNNDDLQNIRNLLCSIAIKRKDKLHIKIAEMIDNFTKSGCLSNFFIHERPKKRRKTAPESPKDIAFFSRSQNTVETTNVQSPKQASLVSRYVLNL